MRTLRAPSGLRFLGTVDQAGISSIRRNIHPRALVVRVGRFIEKQASPALGRFKPSWRTASMRPFSDAPVASGRTSSFASDLTGERDVARAEYSRVSSHGGIETANVWRPCPCPMCMNQRLSIRQSPSRKAERPIHPRISPCEQPRSGYAPQVTALDGQCTRQRVSSSCFCSQARWHGRHRPSPSIARRSRHSGAPHG